MDTVIYDADCGLCTRVKETVEALDWLEAMRWIPSRSVEAGRFGIPLDHLDHAVHLIRANGRTTKGFTAVQGIAARLPITWLITATAIVKRPWSALILAFLFSPLAKPLGDPAYEFIARNRYRLPGSTCALPSTEEG